VGFAIYIFDYLNIITFGEVFTSLGLKSDDIPKIEDPLLLQKEEMKKQWKLLALKEKDFISRTNAFVKKEQKVKDWEDRLKSLAKQMKERETKMARITMSNSTRIKRVQQVANQLRNMPPAQAVARLETMKDDFMVIDIINAIDASFKAEGKKSIVSYYLSLMNKKRAARLMRRIINTSSLKQQEF